MFHTCSLISDESLNAPSVFGRAMLWYTTTNHWDSHHGKHRLSTLCLNATTLIQHIPFCHMESQQSSETGPTDTLQPPAARVMYHGEHRLSTLCFNATTLMATHSFSPHGIATVLGDRSHRHSAAACSCEVRVMYHGEHRLSTLCLNATTLIQHIPFRHMESQQSSETGPTDTLQPPAAMKSGLCTTVSIAYQHSVSMLQRSWQHIPFRHMESQQSSETGPTDTLQPPAAVKSGLCTTVSIAYQHSVSMLQRSWQHIPFRHMEVRVMYHGEQRKSAFYVLTVDDSIKPSCLFIV